MDNLHARVSLLIVDQKGCFFSCNRAQEKASKENNKVDFASDIPADFITVFLPSLLLLLRPSVLEFDIF